jgi:ADP-ribose pyrophosphatase YjhB (NUDIX family)
MKTYNMGVFVIVLNDMKQILLGKRKNSYKSGLYGFPGGRLELHETIVGCGSREVREETGLKVITLQYIGFVRENQEGYNFIHFVFACDAYTGTPTLREPNKCEGWEFYWPNKMPGSLLPGHKSGLEMFLKHDGKPYRDLVGHDHNAPSA